MSDVTVKATVTTPEPSEDPIEEIQAEVEAMAEASASMPTVVAVTYNVAPEACSSLVSENEVVSGMFFFRSILWINNNIRLIFCLTHIIKQEINKETSVALNTLDATMIFTVVAVGADNQPQMNICQLPVTDIPSDMGFHCVLEAGPFKLNVTSSIESIDNLIHSHKLSIEEIRQEMLEIQHSHSQPSQTQDVTKEEAAAAVEAEAEAEAEIEAEAAAAELAAEIAVADPAVEVSDAVAADLDIAQEVDEIPEVPIQKKKKPASKSAAKSSSKKGPKKSSSGTVAKSPSFFSNLFGSITRNLSLENLVNQRAWVFFGLAAAGVHYYGEYASV